MTKDEFIRLVQEAEREVGTRSGWYKLKLALFAAFGYFMIFAILATLVAILGGAVAAATVSTGLAIVLIKSKLIIPMLIMVWVLVKSLWIRFEKPDGYRLTRNEYPELYLEVDMLRRELKALPIHQVLLTPELNARVVQTPRLGVFGWQHNTLVLGLELLLVLSPEEARSVVAHELGHLSRNHSRFAGWIYRVRAGWDRIMEAFHEADSIGARMLRRFFDWYTPRFVAYSFALARMNEYDADAVAARLTSPDTTLLALVNTNVTGPYVDEAYWRWYFRKADQMREPDHPPFAGLTQFLPANPQSREAILDRIRTAMQCETAYDDTHPALKDRIAALKAKPALPQPAGDNNAAAAWLGERYVQVVADFDEHWLADNREHWQERFAYVQSSLASLTGIEDRPREDLSEQELWNLAAWTEEFREDVDPLPLYESLSGPLSRGSRRCLRYRANSCCTRRRSLPDAARAGSPFARAHGARLRGCLHVPVRQGAARAGRALARAGSATNRAGRAGGGREAERWNQGLAACSRNAGGAEDDSQGPVSQLWLCTPGLGGAQAGRAAARGPGVHCRLHAEGTAPEP